MNRKQPLSYSEFKKIYSKVPRLCVDLIISTSDGVLLTLRQKNGWVGQWHLPGGTVLYREPVETTVKRVAAEELGIKISIIRFVGYREYFSEEKERGFGYTISLVFLCKPKSSKLTLDNQVGKAAYYKTLPKNTIKEHRELLGNEMNKYKNPA